MKKWINFLIKLFLIGIICFTAILYFVPEGRNPSFNFNQLNPKTIDFNQLNPKTIDFNQLADIFKSFTTNINQNLDIKQYIITDNKNIHAENQQTGKQTETQQAWAVVSSPVAAYYTGNGKFAGHLTPGELLTIIKTVFTKKGVILVCKKYNNPNMKPFLTKPKYIIIHKENMANVSDEMKSLYTQYAKLNAKIIELKNKQKYQLRRDNPFAQEYTMAKKEYVDYWKKVQKLTVKRDNATDSKSIKYGDQLRKMRSDTVVIENNFKKAKEDYKTWNTIHPAPADSAEINKLLTEQIEIGKIIKEKENI